jgi:hypothetical protein
MRRIATCAAAFLLVASIATPSYAKGGNGGGRPATAGARAKAPKSSTTTKVKTTGPKSNTATTAQGKTTAPGQVKKTTPDGTAAGANVPKSAKLQARLQEQLGGMPLDEAAEGFKNQGQFIAAVHAADRLDVDFDDFKAKMLGTEGGESLSLGQTIQFFDPAADADGEADAAESLARQDLK